MIKKKTLRKKLSIPKLKKKLWELCKQIVRERAKRATGEVCCYTCGRLLPTAVEQHTAHFIASSIGGVGLRFDLKNLRVCCYRCNVSLSGNWPAYYERMVKEVGQEAVDELMRRRNEFTKADAFYYQAKIDEYQMLVDKLGTMAK